MLAENELPLFESTAAATAHSPAIATTVNRK